MQSRSRSWSSTDLLMLSTVAIWGVNFTIVKLALRDFSPLVFNGLRFGVATLIMFAILIWRARTDGQDASVMNDPAVTPGRSSLHVPRYDWGRIILLGLGGHTFYQLMFINGLARTAPANSSLLMATSPIWVAVIGYLLGIERINRTMWAGILLSFTGIIVLISGGENRISLGSETLVGDLLLLGCAVAWALYTTASKPLLARYSPLELTTWTMVAGTVPLLLISAPAFVAQNWRVISMDAWGGLAYSTLLAVVVGYLFWYTSVQRVGNARTAVYSNLTPVIAIVFAWLTIGSALTPLQLLGAAVVLTGLIVTRRGRTR